MSAEIEKASLVRVAVLSDGGALLMVNAQEDRKLAIELTADMATQLTRDLIAAGFGPAGRGGRS